MARAEFQPPAPDKSPWLPVSRARPAPPRPLQPSQERIREVQRRPVLPAIPAPSQPAALATPAPPRRAAPTTPLPPSHPASATPISVRRPAPPASRPARPRSLPTPDVASDRMGRAFFSSPAQPERIQLQGRQARLQDPRAYTFNGGPGPGRPAAAARPPPRPRHINHRQGVAAPVSRKPKQAVGRVGRPQKARTGRLLGEESVKRESLAEPEVAQQILLNFDEFENRVHRWV